MDHDDETPSIDERLREVARSRAIAAALLHGADAADVDDVLQEASLAALATDAPPGGRFVAWLHGAVRHLARTTLRRRARRAAREERAAAPLAQPSAAELAQRLARHRELLAAVEELSDPIRAAIVCRYLDEVPPRAIAREQNVPLATVKTRLRRGLAQLRERLNREWGGELGVALITLSRGGVGATASTAAGAGTASTVASAAVGSAAAGVVVMTLKAKFAVAAVALVVVAVTTVHFMKRSRVASDGSSSESVTAAASRGVGHGDASSESAAIAVERVAVPTDEPAPGSRRARLGPRRVASLAGRVVGDDDEPAAGIDVEIVRSLAADLPIQPSATDDPLAVERAVAVSGRDGSFHFDDLVRGASFDLFANGANGRCGVVRGVRAGISDPVVITLQSTATVSGVVVDARDGRPVAGATVKLRNGTTDRRHFLVTTADGEGRFSVPEVVGKSVLALASAPDGRVSLPCTPKLSPGERLDLRIEVGRAGAADGTVVDAESGEPIADAAIVLSEWNDLVAARSDEHGAFQLRPSSSPTLQWVRVIVMAPGYAPGGGEMHVAMEAADPPPSNVLKLHRGRVAIGRVVTRDGSPVVGAVMVAVHAPNSWVTSGRIATTRDDGTFRIEGIETTKQHSLILRHDECEWIALPFPADELSAKEVDFGTIRVGHGAIVAGVVSDDAGTPLAHAHVTLDAERCDPRGCSTDPNGRFEFNCVPVGRLKLKATATDFARPAELVLEVRDDEVVDAVALMIPKGLTIAGRVVDVGGAPSTRAQVVLERRSQSGRANISVGATNATESDASFRFVGLEPGAYVLKARPFMGESNSAPVELGRVDAGTTDLLVVLPDATFATGRVVDGSGLPVADAVLNFIDPDGKRVGGGVSTADGSFKIAVPADLDLRLEARLFDPRHPKPVMETPVLGSLDHVRAGGPPITLVVAKP